MLGSVTLLYTEAGIKQLLKCISTIGNTNSIRIITKTLIQNILGWKLSHQFSFLHVFSFLNWQIQPDVSNSIVSVTNLLVSIVTVDTKQYSQFLNDQGTEPHHHEEEDAYEFMMQAVDHY